MVVLCLYGVKSESNKMYFAIFLSSPIYTSLLITRRRILKFESRMTHSHFIDVSSQNIIPVSLVQQVE